MRKKEKRRTMREKKKLEVECSQRVFSGDDIDRGAGERGKRRKKEEEKERRGGRGDDGGSSGDSGSDGGRRSTDDSGRCTVL